MMKVESEKTPAGMRLQVAAAGFQLGVVVSVPLPLTADRMHELIMELGEGIAGEPGDALASAIGMPVAVLRDQAADMVASMLGGLLAGGAPLSPEQAEQAVNPLAPPPQIEETSHFAEVRVVKLERDRDVAAVVDTAGAAQASPEEVDDALAMRRAAEVAPLGELAVLRQDDGALRIFIGSATRGAALLIASRTQLEPVIALLSSLYTKLPCGCDECAAKAAGASH